MNGNNTKILICSFMAAGLVCLVVGLIVYFTNSFGIWMVVGIAAIIIGAVNFLVSSVALIAVVIKGRLANKHKNKNDKE